VVIIGDFNDYLSGTMCTTCGGVSPYKNFIDDLNHYKGVTSNLKNPHYGGPVIDNIIISNELFDEYLSNSAFNEVSATQTIPSYYSTTSDHVPVSVIFRIPSNVSVTDMPAKSSFYVYPNPTTGVLNLIQEKIDNGELTIKSMEMFDMYGRKCHASHVTCHENKIDISHLPAGIYFLKIDGETTKVIKY
jgi:hypothetical protein